MTIIKDTFFGGAEKKAGQQQMAAFEKSQDFIREGVKEGKADINRLYPEAQNMMRQGFGGAIDVFNQATPQQMNMFQQGNVGAQNALLSGLPQMNNAILGGPIDYSQLQAQQLQQPNFNFGLPQFLQEPQTQPQQAQQQQPSPFGFLSQYNTRPQQINPFTGAVISRGGGGSGGVSIRDFGAPKMQLR